MARIRTYDAPIDRIRADDRGYAAQENAARRISFKTSEQAQNLRESGRLKGEIIRMQADYDRLVAGLEPEPRQRSAGGGGVSGGGGGGSRGAEPRRAGSTIAPREAAHAAAALASALAGAGKSVDVSEVTGRRHLLYELSESGDAQNSQPFGLNNLWGQPDADPALNPLGRLEGASQFNPLTEQFEMTPPPIPAAPPAEAGGLFWLWTQAVDLFNSAPPARPFPDAAPNYPNDPYGVE